MSTGAYVLEIGDATIGIVVQAEDRHVRFFSAGGLYDRLDGQLFRDAREVLAAARALMQGPVRADSRETQRGPRPIPRGGATDALPWRAGQGTTPDTQFWRNEHPAN